MKRETSYEVGSLLMWIGFYFTAVLRYRRNSCVRLLCDLFQSCASLKLWLTKAGKPFYVIFKRVTFREDTTECGRGSGVTSKGRFHENGTEACIVDKSCIMWESLSFYNKTRKTTKILKHRDKKNECIDLRERNEKERLVLRFF